MKTSTFLRQHYACRDVAKWALLVSTGMADVWDALIAQGRYRWLVWTATRPGVFPDAALRKMACRFVRETPLSDGRVVWDLMEDDRSRSAVETAEAYADGKATDDELESAYDAAYDAAKAARAAYAVAADAAAYAAGAAYNAAEAAYNAAEAAACAAYYAADAAIYDATDAATYDVYHAAKEAAYAAQIKMIAELGNPFRKESVK